MTATLLGPHLDQFARDFLDDLGLPVSEIDSGSPLFDDDAVDTVEVLAE